jgi:hypothetical protein
MISLPSCQRIDEGPTVNWSGVWRNAARPRSVIVNLPPLPYVATLMQQLFAGSRRPDHPYQGEKTDPMNPIIEIALVPQSLIPSTYHQA